MRTTYFRILHKESPQEIQKLCKQARTHPTSCDFLADSTRCLQETKFHSARGSTSSRMPTYVQHIILCLCFKSSCCHPQHIAKDTIEDHVLCHATVGCKADSYAYEKLIRKWTKSGCFFRDQKHERRPSYAYGFGLLCFRQTRIGLPMRVRYSNEIAEMKWPPIFQNKRVRYARKSGRAGPLQ